MKLAAVNSRPRSSHATKQFTPVLTITDLEQKLRKKVHWLSLVVDPFSPYSKKINFLQTKFKA